MIQVGMIAALAADELERAGVTACRCTWPIASAFRMPGVTQLTACSCCWASDAVVGVSQLILGDLDGFAVGVRTRSWSSSTARNFQPGAGCRRLPRSFRLS